MGILTQEGSIDIERMTQVREVSAPLMLTFHRAFDVINLSTSPCVSTVEAVLQQVLDLGCERLLTSGMAEKADSEGGIACLKRLREYAAITAPKCVIVAASGGAPLVWRRRAVAGPVLRIAIECLIKIGIAHHLKVFQQFIALHFT